MGKSMKKFLTIIISLICVLSMTGCGITFNFGHTDNSSEKDNTQMSALLDNTAYVAGDSSYLLLGPNMVSISR